MKIVVANSVGRLDNGDHVVLFPSRWDCNTGAGKAFAYYPYELAYLSKLIKSKTDHDVTFIDGNMPDPTKVAYGWNSEEYAERLLEIEPDVIVTECSALTFESMTNAVMPCKERYGTKLLLTGPYATYCPEGAKAVGWDATFAGEYEVNVLRWLWGMGPKEGYIDLDYLPWPEDNDIKRIDYWEYSNPCGNRPGLIQVYPTRGCPLSCTFCAVPLYYGGHGKVAKSHRTRDIEDVCSEIQYLASRYNSLFLGCFFNEETHNANPKWFTAFCRALIDKGLNEFMYDAMCGYWPFTEEMVQLAAHAGYKQLRIGVENLSDESGKAIKKNVNIDKLQQFMEWCKSYGIRVYGTFQIGAPGSTQDSDLFTMAQARKWRRDGLMSVWQCSISTPQPGTPFHQQCKANGWLVTEDLSRYNGVEPVVSYPHYPAEEIRTTRDLVCQT
jgi:hypothetical protein